MLKLIRKAATSLLISALVLTPTLSEAAGYQYFRMYGHGGQMLPPGGEPQQGTLSFAMQAPANPTVGQAFAGTPQVAGAVGAPAFSVQSGSLPTGTTLNSSTGTITGTLSSAGTYDATLKVVDAVNSTGFASLRVVVSSALTAGWVPAAGKVGDVYVPAAPIAAGGRAPFVYSLSGAAPAGLVFSQASGLLAGTPTVEGDYALSVTIVDADGRSASTGVKTLSIAPADVTGPTDPALSISGTPGAVAQVGVGYSAHFSGVGGTAPFSFDLAAGSLPPGLVLASDGTISGTPLTAGTYSGLQVRVRDAMSSTALSGVFSITVQPEPQLLISGNPSGTARVGASYSATFTALDGSGAGYSFSLLSGTLPPGLTLTSANGTQGLISGSPTHVGSYSGIIVRVTDSHSNVADSAPFTIVVSPIAGPALAVAGAPAANGEVGVAYTATFSASGGTGSGYVFSIASGSLPAGLSFSTSGGLSGAPTVSGTSNFAVAVTDSSGDQTQASYSITIWDALTAPTATFANGEVGVSYTSAAPAAHGGFAPYVWSLGSGSLPAGLSLDTATGLISGLPTAAATAVFTLRVTDALGVSSPVSSPISLTINQSLAVGGTPAANGEVGAVYTAAFSATGGAGGYMFSIASGALPAGLALSSAGSLSGVPTASGTFRFTIAVSDSLGGQAEASYSIAIWDALTAPTGTFANGEVGVSYVSAAPAVHGGLGPYVWSLASGALPAGLSLDGATGVVTGTPTSASTAAFTLQVTDALGLVSPASSSISLTIYPSLAIAGAPAADGEVGLAYTATFSASGGTGSGYLFSVGSGALPQGLTLSSSGSLTGTPTTSGTFGFTVAVTDSLGGRAQAAYSVVISGALTAPTASFANGEVGVAYTSAAPAAHGGLAPYVWSLASGSLPAGLSLNTATGVVSGLPTAASTAVFALKVTDALGAVSPASAAITLTINQSLQISGTPPANGEVGAPYSATFSASGGTGSGYSFSIASGALPAGLTISTAGVLSGTPTSTGNFGFTVAVTDSLGGQAQASYSIAVSGALTAPTATFANGEVGVSYVSAAPTAHGGLAPYVWSLASGSLPAGLTVSSSTGVVSGLPTAATTAVFTLKVTDALGLISPASSAISLTIDQSLTVAGMPPANGEIGVSYTANFTASGGTGSGYMFSIASGALPAGLALSAAGVLSGVPTSAGTFGFTVAVTDSLGGQAQASYSIAISGALTAPTATFANGEVGVSYTSAAPAAHGGLAPYVWSLASGSLPAGLSLNGATGVVSGLPTAASTAVFALKVTDALGAVSPASAAITLTINQSLQISGTPPANGEVGASYTASFSATGGTGSGYVFSIASGALPAGLTLSAAGSLAGTPTASGSFSFTVAVADSAGGHGQASHSITISDALTAPTAAFNGGMVGVAYTSAAPTVHGGLAPYVWSLASGTLPAGLSLDGPTGVVSGVPSATSTTTFTLKVTDALGLVSPASSAISITIDPTLAISSGTYTLTLGNAASFTPAIASGGSGIYSSYAVVNGAGSLSALGLSFNTSGTITGTPTAAGSWTGSVVVTDSHGHTATSGQVMVYVDPSISISGTPPTGQVNSPYNFAMAVSGGSGTYSSYSVANTSGTLAALGLSLSGGSITGTPNAAGTWSGTITVVDSHGTSKTSGSLTVKIAPTLLISGTPAQGNAGVAYSFTPTVSGGSGSYTSYAVTTTSGTLGALGLAFAPSTGKISGSTPVAGSWSGTITVTDSDGNSVTSSSLTVQIVGPLAISGTPTTGAVVGNAYSWTPSISGGTGPYAVSYTTSSGQTLTSMGLSFSATTGAISGTPSSGGVWNGTISVTDAAKTTVVSSSLTLSVAGAAPTISGGPLKTPWATNVAMPGTTFTATGGVQPYTWTLAAGSTAVPAGLSISSLGVVSGTPTTAGTYNFNVKATNATGGQAGTLAVTLVVSSSSFVATSGGLDGLTINRWPGFNAAPLFTSTAYNASGSVTWAMTGQGASGLSINSSTGAVSGTLSSTYGVYPLTVTGTDSASHVASFAVTVTISHRSGSSGGSDPLAATIYLNGTSCGTGTVGAATCSGTLSGVNSTLELVYPINVQSSQFTFNATTWPTAVNLEVSYGDGVSYTTCATGSVSSGTPAISCPASASVYASHYRARVISMTGSMANPGLKVNAYFDPP